MKFSFNIPRHREDAIAIPSGPEMVGLLHPCSAESVDSLDPFITSTTPF